MSYTKAYENKPIWINNREPAINEQRLNALSGAVDVIDNRVIDLDDKRIENIAGVNTVNRQDGQVLAYNETTNKWENRYISGPEGSPSYTPLLDKPQINGHVLSGNLTGKDLLLDNKTTTSRDIADSSEGGLLIHHIDGKSTQNGTPTPTTPVPIESVSVKVKTQSKNLIPFPYYTGRVYTTNGITFTEFNDGTVVANGTANTGAAFYNCTNRILSNWYLKRGTYRISGCPSGGSNSTYRIVVQGTNESGSVENFAYDTGNGINFEINDSQATRQKQISLQVLANTTVNNLVFKPMVTYVAEDGTYPTTFEKGMSTNADTSLVLRSIGDIKDELIFEDNKYKVLRRIGEYIIPSDAQVTAYPTFDTANAKCSRITIPYDTSGLSQDYANLNAVCSHFHMYAETIRNKDEYCGLLQTGTKTSNATFGLFKYSSVADFTSLVASGNVKLLFELSKPVVEELTDEAIKLLGLKSWNEQTHITLDSAIDTPITVEYATNNGNGRGLNGYTVALANEIKLNQLTMANMLS